MDLGGRPIEYELIQARASCSTIVFLHEGSGPVALRKEDFPRKIAAGESCRSWNAHFLRNFYFPDPTSS
jgi:hypothetical protein